MSIMTSYDVQDPEGVSTSVRRRRIRIQRSIPESFKFFASHFRSYLAKIFAIQFRRHKIPTSTLSVGHISETT